MTLALVLVFSLLGSAGAVMVSGLFLLFPEKVRRLLIPVLVSYASGTLLGAAFLGLLPHALGRLPPVPAMYTVLAGMLLFFVLEKLVIWRHCHDEACEVHGVAGPLLLAGDALHNFIDGVVIAAAFIISPPLGVSASLAVIAHEIPQEVGDFAVLLDSGYGRARAFVYNTLSGLATLPGAVAAYFFLKDVESMLPYVIALSAASFIYIATVDLLPMLHRRATPAEGARQTALLLLGVGTIALLHTG